MPVYEPDFCQTIFTFTEEIAMKKTVCVLAAALATTVLAGCEITGPHVRLKPPITVEGDHDHHRDRDRHERGEHDHDNDGDFCPPGQAKKGRC
jgi:hypothetical protein